MDNLPISEQELAGMDLICRAATEGRPWAVIDNGMTRDLWDGKDYIFDGQGAARHKEGVKNLEFAANARQNLPRLIAEVRRQREEIAALKG